MLSAIPKPTVAFESPPTAPLKVGLADCGFSSRAVCVATLTVFEATEVLSTLHRPTVAFESPPTVPRRYDWRMVLSDQGPPASQCSQALKPQRCCQPQTDRSV